MSLSFVQGSVMAAAIAGTADDAHHGLSGCDGCRGGDHNDMNAGLLRGTGCRLKCSLEVALGASNVDDPSPADREITLPIGVGGGAGDELFLNADRVVEEACGLDQITETYGYVRGVSWQHRAKPI